MSSDDDDWREDPEPDPPSLGPDPPSVDVPEVETPEVETPEVETPEVETPDRLAAGDSEVAGLFWRLVLVVDVAILALALGPMFVYFEGDWQRGGTLFAFGLLVLLYGVVQYRRYRSDDSRT